MRLEQIYGIIAKEGFTDIALQEINDYIKDIQNGTEDFPRFNLSASCKAEGREGGPANWEIDERQEQLIEQWAKASNLWEDNSEQFLIEEFGSMIAQGAEAKVYYKEGDTSVIT